VDTAPTGHALRLLAAPGELASVAAALDALQADHRTIRQQFARVGRTDAADAVIAYLSREAQASGALLRDAARTAFHWVMLPEALSLAETDDGLRALEAARIPVGWLVVNRVIAAGRACPICDRLRAEESRVLAETSTRLANRARVQLVYEAGREPRGVDALGRVRRVTARRQTVPKRRVLGSTRYSVPAAHPDGRRALLQRLEGAELLFVAGKGGVGKTTVAAALAIELSHERGGRTLLLSTDPAHSAGDALRRQAGDTAARVSAREPLLWVRELDAAAALAAQRTNLQAALQELADTAGASSDAAQLSRLLDLAPPGLDELVGMLSVLDAREAYGTVLIDMAPTGHALRLLEMPETAHAWAQALLRILLKYRELVRPGQLASTLVSLSRSIRELRGILADARLARAVVVTRAAAVPAAEHTRLLRRLRRLGLEVAGVVVNARTLDPGGCGRCRRVASAERLVLPALKSASRRGARASIVVEAPLAAPPPRGAAALRNWSQTWTT
jgi:arsenite-transporting ATPase